MKMIALKIDKIRIFDDHLLGATKTFLTRNFLYVDLLTIGSSQ